MSFYERLQLSTACERDALLASPIVADALAGDISQAQYVDFLRRAYHHVRHTPSLLMACGARLPLGQEWLRAELVEYATEELGHEEWILADIDAAGGDAVAVRDGEAPIDSEILVAYMYDTIARGNPVGMFGMVYVLEGTSVRLATRVAESVQDALGLSARACTYLRSHGALDVEHVGHLESLLDRLALEDDRRAVEHAAKVCFRLYGNVLNGIGRRVA